MVPCGPLIPVAVVPGEPGHQLLWVSGLDVLEEVGRPATTQNGGVLPVVGDPHVAGRGHRPVEAFR